ncbi:MAG: prepilin-type N-terminal cleavage/methylation domain-containing protein [Candidatus Babeliales bacterium]
MKRVRHIHGFTLIELMIVVAIVAFLSMISMPSFMRFLSKAKRAEAYMNLGSLSIAQKAYHAEHGKFTPNLSGAESVGWKPEGYSGGGSGERFYYTYGFSEGQEGQQHFTGKLNTPASDLKQTQASKDKFTAAAAGDIDGDGQPDILTVNEYNDIKIVQDDLA